MGSWTCWWRLRTLSDLFDFVHNEKNEKQLCQTLTDTFILDYNELYWIHPDESKSLQDNPEEWITHFKATYLAPSSYDGRLWSVEIRNMVESTSVRDIDSNMIGKLIQIEALVVTATIPDATVVTAVYKCETCGEKIKINQDGFELKSPDKCYSCDNRRRFKIVPEECIFIDTRQISLQERPEELPPGEVPEPLTTILKGDLIRVVTPGDRVKIVGVVKAKPVKRGSLDFTKILEANSIEVLNRNNIETKFDEERIQQIVALSQQPNLEDMLINSYCPSIHGWKHVKKANLRCVFGGMDKNKQGSFVRGWINGLMVGDPGLSKTAFLLFGRDVCQRGVYDMGRGVTGIGLTAALVKENDKFVISTGTLGKADRGNAFIDEFEKMSKEDRDIIHVPMENGIIPISKGGLRATINSRCSLLAAMNPIDGRYNISKTLTGNIRKKPEDFPDSLVTRFDWIFIMVDEIKSEVDEAVADKMLKLDDVNVKEIIPIDLLRDYITYSKHINPTIPRTIREKMRDYYKLKRQEMKNDISKMYTPRQLESLERMIEARARMHLRNEANEDDFNDTIWLQEIYINETWKDPYTGEVDTGPMLGITETSLQKQAKYVPRIVESIYADGKAEIDAQGERYVKEKTLTEELMARSGGKIDRYRAKDVIKWAIDADYIWDNKRGLIKLPGDRNRMLGADDNKP